MDSFISFLQAGKKQWQACLSYIESSDKFPQMSRESAWMPASSLLLNTSNNMLSSPWHAGYDTSLFTWSFVPYGDTLVYGLSAAVSQRETETRPPFAPLRSHPRWKGALVVFPQRPFILRSLSTMHKKNNNRQKIGWLNRNSVRIQHIFKKRAQKGDKKQATFLKGFFSHSSKPQEDAHSWDKPINVTASMGLRHQTPPKSGSCTSQSASKFYSQRLRQTANMAYN